MPPRRPSIEELKIEQPKQLLVEGNDPRNFFEALLKHINRQDVQIHNFGGVDELPAFLRGFTGATGYSSVTSLGIVRDAEGDENSAWQSVQSALQRAGMPVPARVGQRSVADSPHVTVLILPGDGNPGMLETVLNRTFANDPVNTCINDFFACVERLPGKRIHGRDKAKARARAYMWTREKPHVSVGVAAQAGYWDFEHEAFVPLRSFLTAL